MLYRTWELASSTLNLVKIKTESMQVEAYDILGINQKKQGKFFNLFDRIERKILRREKFGPPPPLKPTN